LAERDPVQFWQAVAIVSLIINLLLLYVVIVG
jgi:hypothetical protein